ncbi:MAG: hypothetical protein C0602_09215 [Denitrovibrio sp.]|nr:MAG: hypothetical protein C0602_09215 [Denitrovibrio sp.]
MPEKMMGFFQSIIVITIFFAGSLQSFAHEDDYIVGLSAFRDGLYEISAPSLETYLQGETEKRKANYSHYLLYRIYMQAENSQKALEHLDTIDNVSDRRFDREIMSRDKMQLLAETSCSRASNYLKQSSDEVVINYFLDSKCEPDKSDAEHILKNTSKDDIKLKLVSKFSKDTTLTASVFDGMELEKLDDNSKKYFALYFYKNGDLERFAKVREVYEDSDVIGLELDSMWQNGDKDAFISGFTKYNDKYELAGANACRAIDVYKNKGIEFDCDLVNECMQGYSVEFVKVKGACLVKQGNKKQITEFIDSLKSTIFPGMCGYGEYVFYNELYAGVSQDKFYQCDEKYKFADILMSKKQYQSVVNMFFKKPKDMDKYYTASALRGLGKTKAANNIADAISDEELKAKYKGGV